MRVLLLMLLPGINSLGVVFAPTLLFSVSFFFPFIFIGWRLITLQYCSGFCHTLTRISHGVTCIPLPLGLPSASNLGW